MSYCPLWEKHVYTGSLNIGCSHHVQNIMFSFFLHQLQLCWMKYYTRNTIQRTFGVLQSSLNHKVVFCLPTLLFQIKLLRTKMFWAWWLYLGLRETGPTLDNCITGKIRDLWRILQQLWEKRPSQISYMLQL